MPNEYIGQRPPHTALPNWLRGKASPLELATLWALQSHYPNIHPSLSLLAKEACISRRTVCTVLGDMERKGWLVRDQAFDGAGRKTSNRYSLTIWDIRWFAVASAEDALVQEMHHRSSAEDAPSLVQEMHIPSAGDAHKEEQSKKNRFKPLEPPLPPSGGSAREDQREPIAAEPQTPIASPPIPLAGGIVAEPPPPEPKPVKPRKPRFKPSQDLIPINLLTVGPEILGFWATKAGAKSEQAWQALISQLTLILDDPMGGAEPLRSQLQTGIDRAPIKPWMSVTYANWKQFGPRPGAGSQITNRRQTQDEAAAEAVAYIEARDARRAAAAAGMASRQTVLCEVIG